MTIDNMEPGKRYELMTTAYGSEVWERTGTPMSSGFYHPGVEIHVECQQYDAIGKRRRVYTRASLAGKKFYVLFDRNVQVREIQSK